GAWGPPAAAAGCPRSFGAPAGARRAAAAPGGCLEHYLKLRAGGSIQEDPRMGMLDELQRTLASYSPKPVGAPRAQASGGGGGGGGGGGLFSGLFGGGAKPKAAATPAAPPAPKPAAGQVGLYLWGGTGTGKTFMMDIFYDTMPIQRKKRIHFHEWMIDVHNRLHKKQKGSSANTNKSADDLVEQVAAEMLDEAWLLCFDEFQVTHISDAIIMKRIFSVLFERGAVVVATSNRPPEDLYLNGLNRPLFLPFIPMLQDFCRVHPIGAEVDYRMIAVGAGEDSRTYIHPLGEAERKLLEYKFAKICQGNVLTSAQLEVQGRKIFVPRCAETSNVAWFGFADLCDRPLGAADYLAIGTAFHTVFIADIPRLTMQERDQVRRFITCIDSLYERHTKVVCTAALDPISLFHVTEEERKTSVADEIFAWDRTVSRLMEMQSAQYLLDVIKDLDADQFIGQYSLKSLTDEDMNDLWKRYDSDENGHLDKSEFRVLLEDLLEKQKGHRNLSDDVFDECMKVADKNQDGVIQFSEIKDYLGEFSQVQSTLRV
ncbi:unnamed protein product, partial [Prorocentrum cordatum]